MRALKSPSEKEVTVPVDNTDNPDEDERDSEEDDKRSCYEPRVCSSEESTHSRSKEEEENSGKSGSVEVVSEESNERVSRMPLFNAMEASRKSSLRRTQ